MAIFAKILGFILCSIYGFVHMLAIAVGVIHVIQASI
jgi:hypothetical protein